MLEPGHLLQDRYEIVQLLGAGGMAHVYLATDARLGGRLVALKEMDPSRLSASGSSWAKDAFLQEAQVLARLNHPGIARVTDFFEHEVLLYLVMEYVQGETLEAAMQRTPQGFAESQMLAWASQLIAMLDYLHSQIPPVIFRDLKPGNIMVRPDGTLKLIDFGIARYFKPGQVLDTVRLGTPGYAAPEAYGQGQTTVRSDIYSLGVLLHQIVTGHDPTRTPMVLPPVTSLAPGVSAAVAQVLAKATAPDPALRFASVQQLAAALGLAGGPPRPGAGLTEGLAPPPKSRRALWAGAGALLLLLLGGLGWALGARNGAGGDQPVAPQVVVVAPGRATATSAPAAGDVAEATAEGAAALTAEPSAGNEAGDSAPAAAEGEQEVVTPEPAASPEPSLAPATETAAPTATWTPLPTLTPLPMPTPLPTLTPQPTRCSLAVGSAFSSRYSNSLGCPLNAAHSTYTALENFERGYMIWRQDSDEIYAIYHGGTWNRFGDLFAETMPNFSCGVESSPPTPVRGFGMIWCRYSYVQDGLGNATNAEWGSTSSAQDFANGTIVQTDMGTFVLYYDGTWR